MSTWILRHEPPAGAGLRVGVKDLIDVEGEPTTAACRAVARSAEPAAADAACLAGLRAAIARGEAAYVGKTNLHELAYGITGVNAAFGTPVNPLDPRRVPGGSSSGSAVAVAAGEADMAYGTDTGGSIRIPAACCGVAGLKTTHGRVPLDGVRPLAPSLDTVGPMARDVAGLVAGMALLEPGFTVGPPPAGAVRVGRWKLGEAPAVAAAVDAALAEAGWDVVDLPDPGLAGAGKVTLALMAAEAWAVNGHLVRATPELLGEDVRGRLEDASHVRSGWAETVGASRTAAWSPDGWFADVDVIAFPTLLDDPPLLEDAGGMAAIRGANAAVNFAGLPAVVLPVPRPGRLPASLQLIGPAGSEERLLALAGALEAAIRSA